jgi:hypothetical protein
MKVYIATENAAGLRCRQQAFFLGYVEQHLDMRQAKSENFQSSLGPMTRFEKGIFSMNIWADMSAISDPYTLECVFD